MNFNTPPIVTLSPHNHTPSSLRVLGHDELLRRTKNLASEERRIGVELLHHLREIERRRLYACTHGSLHEYVVSELGYSDGAAHRRISAMRLLQTVPELEEKLRSGAVNLSTASQVQNFLAAEKRITGHAPAPEVRRELVAAIEGKTTRQTEAMLAERSPRIAEVLRERPRAIDGERIQITLVIGAELQQKLKRLRDRFAHQNPNPSLSEQLEMLADFVLRTLDGARARRNEGESNESRRRSDDAANGAGPTARGSQRSRAEVPQESSKANSRAKVPLRPRRHIPIAIRRRVWARAEGRCEQRLNSAETGGLLRRCSRTHRLQVDHRVPFSWGGRNELENLQLLCSVHNSLKSDQLGVLLPKTPPRITSTGKS